MKIFRVATNKGLALVEAENASKATQLVNQEQKKVLVITEIPSIECRLAKEIIELNSKEKYVPIFETLSLEDRKAVLNFERLLTRQNSPDCLRMLDQVRSLFGTDKQQGEKK